MRIFQLLLAFIVLLAAFLRFFQLSTLPPSLTWDEVAWGYNAYSLGVDGKDEFGKFMPITYLESFGDYKPPMYAYLTIIPVALFGLNEFTTRFASAFLGSAIVLLTYFLVLEVFRKKAEKRHVILALLSAFLLAISPWHILLSRAAFEANVATFFIVSGILLFLKWEYKGRLYLILSLLAFVFSMYTFNTARIVSPILALGLLLVNRNEVLKRKWDIVISGAIAFIIFLPLLLFLRTPQAQLRFQEVNIFTDGAVINRANREIQNDNNAWWSKIIHNRRLQYSVEYVKHYFDNLNPQFLFIKGDGNPKFSIQDVGQMYIWEIPFFVAGILYLFKKKEGKWWVIPFWLVVGILPAATARETPHALRIEATLPTFQILSAYGLLNILASIPKKVKNMPVRNISVSILSLIISLNFLYFYHTYTVHYPREYSGEWQYGYKEAIDYVMREQDKYDEIHFTDLLGRPYAYVLFYTQYDPEKFRKEAGVEREALGFVHVNKFGKYMFPKKLDTSNPLGKNILFIDVPTRVPKEATVKKEFKLLNGETVLTAFTK